jgi:hypothetical protein
MALFHVNYFEEQEDIEDFGHLADYDVATLACAGVLATIKD